jgi:hypothetical protein
MCISDVLFEALHEMENEIQELPSMYTGADGSLDQDIADLRRHMARVLVSLDRGEHVVPEALVDAALQTIKENVEDKLLMESEFPSWTLQNDLRL